MLVGQHAGVVGQLRLAGLLEPLLQLPDLPGQLQHLPLALLQPAPPSHAGVTTTYTLLNI